MTFLNMAASVVVELLDESDEEELLDVLVDELLLVPELPVLPALPVEATAVVLLVSLLVVLCVLVPVVEATFSR